MSTSNYTGKYIGNVYMKSLLILPITTFLLIVLYAGRDLLGSYQVSTIMAIMLFLLVDALLLWLALAGIRWAVWAAHWLLNRADTEVSNELISKEEYQEV